MKTLSIVLAIAFALSLPTSANAWNLGSGPSVDYNPGVLIWATPQTITAGEPTTVRFRAPLASDDITTSPQPDVSENCTTDFAYTEVTDDFIPGYPWGTMGETTVHPTETTTYTATCRLWQTQSQYEVTYRYETSSVTVTVNAGADLTAGGITPTQATQGSATTLSASIFNSGGTTTPGGFQNLFQRATDASGTGAVDIGTYNRATALGGSQSFIASLGHTFSSAGTWYVRACADKNSGTDSGSVVESSETNNCGAWTAVVVSAAPEDISCSLSSNPTPLSGGVSTTFTWSSTGADTCTGSGFSTGGAEDGTSAPVTVVAGNLYQLQCTASGSDPCTQTLTATQPLSYIEAEPDRVNAGDDTLVGWSAANIGSCSITANGTTIAGPLTGPSVATTSSSETVNTQTTFTITCDNGATSDSVIVNVVPKFEEF